MMLNTFIILKFLLNIPTIEKVSKTNYDFMNVGRFLTHEIWKGQDDQSHFRAFLK